MELKRYVIASLGGLIGGILFSLPWILIYTFSPISLPFFAFLIAPGINKWYRIFKGRVNKMLPKFIIGISIFILILIYFLYFPILNGGLSNVLNISYWQLMMRETIISLICAIIGIYKTVEDILYEIGLRY